MQQHTEHQEQQVVAVKIGNREDRVLGRKRTIHNPFVFIANRDNPLTNKRLRAGLQPRVIFRSISNCFRSRWSADLHANVRIVIDAITLTLRVNPLTTARLLEPQEDVSYYIFLIPMTLVIWNLMPTPLSLKTLRRELGAALGLTESVGEPLTNATGLNVATDLRPVPLPNQLFWSAIWRRNHGSFVERLPDRSVLRTERSG